MPRFIATARIAFAEARFSCVTWGERAAGGVFQTTDGGATWEDITGELPYCKPLVLRYNPDTGELWAGGVGLYKTRP